MSLNVVGEMEDTADNDIKQSTEQTSLDERRNTEIAEMEKPIKSPILSSAAPIVEKNVIDEVSKQFHEKSNLDKEVNSATTSNMQEETIPDGIDQTAKGLNQGDNSTIEKASSRTNQKSMAEKGPDDIIVLGSERSKMSRTPETVEKTLFSSATKVNVVAIEMDSLGGSNVKEVTARSIAMESTLASDRVTSAELENAEEKENPSPWCIINNRKLVSQEGMHIVDVANHDRVKSTSGTLIRAIDPVPISTQGFHLEMEVTYEGDAKEFLIGFVRQDSKLKVTGLSGWYNNAIGYKLYNSNGSQFHHEPLEDKGILTEKLLSGDIVGCCLKKKRIDGKATMVCFFTKNGLKLKKSLHLEVGEYFPLVGMHTPNVAIRLNLGETEYSSNFAKYRMYEGDWIRDFDQKAVTLNFCENGQLKSKMKNWHSGQSNNLLNVTKEGVTWENEPTVKGNYRDGKITWKNGQKWMRIADDPISGDQEAGEPEDEPRCTVLFWACCVAFRVLMVDIIFNLLLPSIDVITDWMFFIGNIVSLHFRQSLPMSEMKMTQELFILACQRKQNLECFSGECSFEKKWGGIAPIYNDKCHLVNPVCEYASITINETYHYGYFPYEEQDCDYFSALVYFTAVPLILNTVFTIYYWRRDNRANKTSRRTLPLAVLGLYPQYKCLKYIIQRDTVAKEEYLGGLGLLEAWLESTVQVLITSAIMTMPYASPLPFLSNSAYVYYHRSANLYDFISPQFYKSIGFSYFTWVSSIIAMNIGLTKFVCNSPMKANKNVLFTFLLHTSFVIRVTATMIYMTPGIDEYLDEYGETPDAYFNIKTYWQIPLVFALGIVPFTVNLFNLLCRAGATKTWALFKLYPQILISPIFSPFMYTYKSKPKTEQVSKHAEDISLPLTSNIPSSSSDTGDKTGFCIWKWPSFINLIYLSFIPGGIPIRDDESINYFSLIFFLPVAVILLICGVAYFFGSNRCKRIARFEPNVFNPSDKPSPKIKN